MKKLVFAVFMTALVLLTSCAPPEAAGTKKDTGNVYLEKTWMETLDKERVTLKDLEGNVVVLDFWASWCGPCRASIPFYIDMHEKYAADGLEIIGINVNEDEAVIMEYAAKAGINYNLAFFNEDLNSVYKVSGIPAVFIFDKKGNKVANFTGYSSEMDSKIETIIKEEISK